MTTGRSTPRSPSPADDPVFGDELQRRTWMESYVVAYEVTLLATTGLAAVMVWVGGAPLAWWSLAVLATIGVGNLASLSHLRTHGLRDLPWPDRMRYWSFRLRLLLGAVWAVGFLRHTVFHQIPLDDLDLSTVAGMVVGAGLVLALIWPVTRLANRRVETQLPEDDTFED